MEEVKVALITMANNQIIEWLPDGGISAGVDDLKEIQRQQWWTGEEECQPGII